MHLPFVSVPLIGRVFPLLLSLLAGLPLAAPAQAQRGVSQQAVDEAVKRGLEYIKSREEKGTWGSGGVASVGKDSLALYTLLKAGVEKDDELVLRVVTELMDAETKGTYEAAALIMALEAADALAHRLRIEELAALLVSWQRDGDWGYPAGSDLSNTQYAVLGLWAATRARVEIPPRVWFDLAPAVLGYRNDDGGFRYTGSIGTSTGSMTAAALTVFGLVDNLAPKKRPWDGRIKRELAKAKEDGLSWLTEAFEVGHNPGADEWHMYYLYSLERLGALQGIQRFGEHSWYDEGAQLLIKNQAEDGAWDLGLAPTCFAVLFLTRATQARSGPDAKASPRAGIEDPESPVQVIAKGDTPLSMWVTGWNEEQLADYVWPGEAGQGPRVSKVDYMLGDEVLASVSASTTEPAGDERFAVQHRFELPGSYELRLRMHLVPHEVGAGGASRAGEIRTVDSPSFRVSVFGAWPAWFKEQSGDPMRNIMPAARWVKTEVSSVQLGGGDLPEKSFEGIKTVDRRSGTPWIAAAEDQSPKLVITFESPVEMDRILLSHARIPRLPLDVIGMAAVAHVRINDERKPKKLKMTTEQRRKTVYKLSRATEVRKIEIVLERAKGDVDSILGLSEVEVQLRGRSRRK